MGRMCSICCDTRKSQLARKMIMAGSTDQTIADKMGGINRMAVRRHRRNHVIAPAKALAEIAGKGRDATEQRANAIAAAEGGDPLAYVGLASIVSDLQRVHDRLERTADAAEQDKQRLAVSSLSAQQLRAAEVRAKIGAVGGYGPGRGSQDSGAGTFNVNIYLGNGLVERITTATGPLVEHE